MSLRPCPLSVPEFLVDVVHHIELAPNRSTVALARLTFSSRGFIRSGISSLARCYFLSTKRCFREPSCSISKFLRRLSVCNPTMTGDDYFQSRSSSPASTASSTFELTDNELGPESQYRASPKVPGTVQYILPRILPAATSSPSVTTTSSVSQKPSNDHGMQPEPSCLQIDPTDNNHENPITPNSFASYKNLEAVSNKSTLGNMEIANPLKVPLSNAVEEKPVIQNLHQLHPQKISKPDCTQLNTQAGEAVSRQHSDLGTNIVPILWEKRIEPSTYAQQSQVRTAQQQPNDRAYTPPMSPSNSATTKMSPEKSVDVDPPNTIKSAVEVEPFVRLKEESKQKPQSPNFGGVHSQMQDIRYPTMMYDYEKAIFWDTPGLENFDGKHLRLRFSHRTWRPTVLVGNGTRKFWRKDKWWLMNTVEIDPATAEREQRLAIQLAIRDNAFKPEKLDKEKKKYCDLFHSAATLQKEYKIEIVKSWPRPDLSLWHSVCMTIERLGQDVQFEDGSATIHSAVFSNDYQFVHLQGSRGGRSWGMRMLTLQIGASHIIGEKKTPETIMQAIVSGA